MLPPFVGILVNDRMHRSIPVGKTKYEAIEFYIEAGQKYGFTPAFFRIQDLGVQRNHVKAYVKQDKDFALKRIPSPLIIHNRAIYASVKDHRKLDAWVREGRTLFNHWNRYSKLHIQTVLRDNSELQAQVPETVRATTAQLQAMMKRHPALILKPDKSSIGRGVMKLERKQRFWQLTYPVTFSIHNKRWRTRRFKGPSLPCLLRARLAQIPYIVQPYLPLATYQGRPFDLRVSVQRAGTGQWQITGIVAKVASGRSFITNVAQGGTVNRLEHILREEYSYLDLENVLRGIHEFAIKVAVQLEQKLPLMADLGLDIGITTEGVPLFIECNSKDQRYSFREAGMLGEWKASYENPMAYAHFLLNRSSVEEPVPPPAPEAAGVKRGAVGDSPRRAGGARTRKTRVAGRSRRRRGARTR
ncbi:YheC/YheD family endospore coat-associated protein [Paenibacillus cremeus]|nr:YheC/YheD family protein [Paenibacillus cremeus]